MVIDVPARAFSISKTQPEKCKAGAFCTFDITATNVGVKSYQGPIVVSDQMPVSATVGETDAWVCAAARRGQTLCVVESVELEPGTSFQLSLPLKMIGYPRGGLGNNCAKVLWPMVGQELGADRGTVQLLQFGANLRGHDVGTPDGVIGPKTKTGFVALLESAGLDSAQMTLENLLRALGWDGLLVTAPVLADARMCSEVQMHYVQRGRAPTAQRSTTRNNSAQSERNRRLLRNITIGVGIHMLNKEKRRKHEHYDE